MLAATYKIVTLDSAAISFVPEIKDHVIIKAADIVCCIKKPAIKPAAILSAFSIQI